MRVTVGFQQWVKVVLVALAVLWCGSACAEPALLEPEQAFALSAQRIAPQTLELRYQIAPGYYLYRDKLQFSLHPAGAQAAPPQLPQGIEKKDDFFGRSIIYRGDLRITIPLQGDVGVLQVTAQSQGCADAGVCYVPIEQALQVSATVSPAAAVSTASNDRRIAALFSGHPLLLLLSFVGFGLLLAFTPCILPMIPILSALIVGQGARANRRSTFLYSVCYVLGMALTYATIGVLAGLSGNFLAATLQQPWVQVSFAAFFVILALSMLGLYAFQMPVSIQSRLAHWSQRLQGGEYWAVTLMGALSALIVGPCVAAPLAGALLYISTTGDAVLGGMALFALAFGMGMPLLLIGASAGTLLPRVGAWMAGVKRFFGVLLLGVAIQMVSPWIGLKLQFWAWAALLLLLGVVWGAFRALPRGARLWQWLAKAGGLAALLVSGLLVVGALTGATDLWRPWSRLQAESVEAAPSGSEPIFLRVKSVEGFEAALTAAKGKPVMLDFYADWCVSCKEMERDTFSVAAVRARLAQMVLLQVDVTVGTPEDQALLRRFQLFGPPGIVFFDARGQEVPQLRVIGFEAAAPFAATLDQVIAR